MYTICTITNQPSLHLTDPDHYTLCQSTELGYEWAPKSYTLHLLYCIEWTM